jgi:hypothetical protein
MYAATKTQTRTASSSSTCTKSRVEVVLDLFCGDLAAFIARGLMTREVAADWLRDLSDVLVFEAVERFQVKVTLPSRRTIALDYEVSDDGRIRNSDASGGFSTTSIPAGSSLAVVLRWRANAPRIEAARKLLRERGWGVGSMLDAAGTPDRAYSEGGYGVYRRMIGDWQ